jgi:hypothetical protein
VWWRHDCCPCRATPRRRRRPALARLPADPRSSGRPAASGRCRCPCGGGVARAPAASPAAPPRDTEENRGDAAGVGATVGGRGRGLQVGVAHAHAHAQAAPRRACCHPDAARVLHGRAAAKRDPTSMQRLRWVAAQATPCRATPHIAYAPPRCCTDADPVRTRCGPGAGAGEAPVRRRCWCGAGSRRPRSGRAVHRRPRPATRDRGPGVWGGGPLHSMLACVRAASRPPPRRRTWVP